MRSGIIPTEKCPSSRLATVPNLVVLGHKARAANKLESYPTRQHFSTLKIWSSKSSGIVNQGRRSRGLGSPDSSENM